MEDKDKLENKAVKPEPKETKTEKVFESIHKDKKPVPGGGFSGTEQLDKIALQALKDAKDGRLKDFPGKP